MVPAAPKRRGPAELSAGKLGVVMNLPTLATLALVLAYPIGYAAYLSFHKVTPAELRRGVFPSVGLGNYQRILSDPLFLLALKNTLVFTAVTVVVELALAIAIALLIDQRQVWTSRVTKFLILLPYAVPPIANGLIWSFMYNFDFGFLNRLLFSAGLISKPVNWIGDPNTALFALTVPYIWRTLPFAVLLVHAALQGINPELYEAASVDGAGPSRGSGTSPCRCSYRSWSSYSCCVHRSPAWCSRRYWRSRRAARATPPGSRSGTATSAASRRRSTLASGRRRPMSWP